ncbi:MAG: GNAT family N-acetyltransferase [Pontixanthobacter sp.]
MSGVRYHDTVKFLQGRMGTAHSPFARLEWLDLLTRHSKAPMIAAIDGGNEWVALPLMREGRTLVALANWYNFTWHPYGAREHVGMRALAIDLRRRTHQVLLSPLTREDAELLRLAFEDGGWRTAMSRSDHNHVLHVNGRSFVQYWASRSGRMRTTLKRKRGRVSVRIIDCFEEAVWDSYQDIYAQSWKPVEGNSKFLREFAMLEGAAGRLRMAIAEHEDVPVAAQFWTVEDGQAYIHKLAHLEEHRHLSAGTVLTAALFEHVIDTDNVACIDFGTGNDPYKNDWMEVVRPRFRLECHDPRQPRAWPILAKHAIRRVARKTPRS